MTQPTETTAGLSDEEFDRLEKSIKNWLQLAINEPREKNAIASQIIEIDLLPLIERLQAENAKQAAELERWKDTCANLAPHRDKERMADKVTIEQLKAVLNVARRAVDAINQIDAAALSPEPPQPKPQGAE